MSQPIVEYFLCNKSISNSLLEYIRLKLCTSGEQNVISILAALRDSPDMHISKETVDQCMLYSPTITISTKEAWLAPACYKQPTTEELSNLSQVLHQVCGGKLLADLIQIVTAYLTSNVERFNVGMPIDLLSTIDLLSGTIDCNRKMVLIQEIRCIANETFFNVETIGLSPTHDEWIVSTSDRIQLLHNCKGIVVRGKIGFVFC